jgi:amino acid permease
MGPKLFAYVDKKGRPLVVTLLQVLFGCLAFINLDTASGGTIFDWLLALSGLSAFFIYGSIAVAHIRFRMAWYVSPFKISFSFADFIFAGNIKVTAPTNYLSKPRLGSTVLMSVRS